MQADVSSSVAVADGTLRTLLATHLPLFGQLVTTTICSVYCNLFAYGDVRGARSAIDFLLKQATLVPAKNNGSAGAQSNRIACLHAAAALFVRSAPSSSSEFADVASLLLKLCTSTDKANSSSLRASAAAALQSLLESQGARFFPAQSVQGPGDTKASPLAKLYSTVLSACYSMLSDESPCVRASVGPLLQAMATGSAGYRAIPCMDLLTCASEGICDPHPLPRQACANAMATILATSILATRLGAVAAEAASAAQRLAAQRGGGESSEDDSDAGDDQRSTASKDAGDDRDVTAEVDGSEGSSSATKGSSTHTAAASLGKEFLGSMRKFGQSVKKAAQAAGKQMQVKDRTEGGDVGKPVTVDAASRAASAVLEGAGGSRRGGGLRSALSKVHLGKGKREAVDVAFTPAAAVAYMCSLIRSSGSMAHRTGCCAAAIRTSCAQATACMLRSVQGAAGGTQDEEYMQVLHAALATLQRTADSTETPSDPYLPSLSSSSVLLGGVPSAGPHAAHMRSCVTYICVHGMMKPPVVKSSYVQPLWRAWQLAMFDKMMVLLVSAARSDSSSVRSSVTRAAGPAVSGTSASAALASPAAGLRKFASKLSMTSSPFTAKPKSGPSSSSAAAATDHTSQPPLLTDAAVHVLLTVLEEVLQANAHPYSPQVLDRAAALCDIAVNLGLRAESHALRIQCARTVRQCLSLNSSPAGELLAELLATVQACVDEIAAPAWLMKASAAAAASALADASLWACRRRGVPFVCPSGSVPVMTHAGATVVAEAEGGFGCPGAGPGSGCGVATGDFAAVLRRCTSSSSLLSVALACLADMMRTGGDEVPVRPALLDTACEIAGLLMTTCQQITPESALGGASRAHIPGPGSSPQSILTHSAVSAFVHETRAALAEGSAAIMSALSRLPVDWLVASNHWSTLYSACARGILLGCAPIAESGVGTSREGTGVWVLTPVGISAQTAAVSSMLSSSSTAHSTVIGSPSPKVMPGEGGGTVAADAAGMGTARSLYSGIASAWQMHLLASTTNASRSVLEGLTASAQLPERTASSLGSLVTLGLRVLTACQVVPASLQDMLRQHPDRARARLLADAANSLLVLPDTASCVSFGADRDGLAPTSIESSPPLVVRGLPFMWEDGQYYSPAGVSLPAVAIARQCVIKAATNLVASASCLPLAHTSCSSFRGSALAATVSLLSCGTVSLVPLELGLIDVPEQKTGQRISSGVVIPEPNCTYTHLESAVSSSLRSLCSHPSDDTWSPLVVALAHGGGLNVLQGQGRLAYEGRPLSLLCADIDDGDQPSASACLQKEVGGSLFEKQPLRGDMAAVLAMCLPALAVQQSALVAQAVGAVLGSGSDLQDEQSEGMTVGYRQAGMSVLSGQARLAVQEHAANVITRMLQELRSDQVLLVAQETSARPSSESSTSGLASATPAAWLTTLRIGLGHALSSRAPRLQATAAAALAQCARLSGPLHGRRLLLSLVKQMAALGGETLAAVAAISAGTEGGEDVTHAARYTQAGVALAIAAIAQEAQTRTVEYDTLSREGRPCTFLPLTMITSAFQVQPVLAVVKEGQQDVLPMLLTAWATVMRTKADEIEHAVCSGSSVSTEMQQSVVHCVTSTLALADQCSLALPSPWEADVGLPREGDDPYGTSTAARSSHGRVVDNVRLTVGSDGSLLARPAGGDDRVTAAAACVACSADGFYSVAALDDPTKGAVAAVSVSTFITHPATGNRAEPALLPAVLPATGEVLPVGALLQGARATLTGRKKRKATASKVSSIDSLISAAISLNACTGSVPGRAMAAATCAALETDVNRWSRNGRSMDTRETVCVRACTTALSIALADAVRALSFLSVASAAELLPHMVSCLSTLSVLATTAQQGSALLQAMTGIAKLHGEGGDAVSAISLAAVRCACSGSGPVSLVSSTASPLPQVLGGCVSGPPLPPLPSSTDTDKHNRRIVHLLLGSVQNAGVPLYMEDRPAAPSPVLAAWQACRAESTLSMVPCGLTTGVEESTLPVSPQFLALQIVESRRCGRQRVHLFNPSATAVPTRAWGCLLALACSSRETVPVCDALDAWAKLGASSTWPSYFVSVGLLGDVLLSVPRDAWPHAQPGAQAAVHSLVRALANRPLVLQDRVLSLCDIISGQQTVSAANAAHFAAHAAQQGVGKSASKQVKGDDEGGDFGATAGDEDADEDAAGANDSVQQAATGSSSELPFSLSQLDSDASRCSLLSPSLDNLYTLFDTGVWRAAGDEAKVRACALLQGILDDSPSLPGLLSVPVGTALLLATCQLCAYESAALATPMETGEDEARDHQGRQPSAPSAVYGLSTLCREAVLLLAAIVRAYRRLADPDVPGTHGLAQHAATLLPVLLPLLRDDVPLGTLSVAVNVASDCILCGMLSDSGSVRRVLQALLPHPQQQLLAGQLPMSQATMVKAVAASKIVSFALYMASEQCTFESSFPSSLRPYQSTLRAWPTPPWAPRTGDIMIVRLGTAARAAIVACMQDNAIKWLYKTMLLAPAAQDRSCIRYCLASLMAVASLAGTSGVDVIPALPGAQRVAGLFTQDMKDAILNDAFVASDVACSALCSVPYIAVDGAAPLPAALAHAAAKHPLPEALRNGLAAFAQGQSKLSVQQGIADVYAAVGKPHMTLSSWLSCFTNASASSQATLQALAEVVLQAREYDKASPAILPLFTGALGSAERPSLSRSAVSAIRHVAKLDQGQAQTQLVSLLQHTLALALSDPTRVVLTQAAWEHAILPLVPIAPALLHVYVSHLCQLLTEPLQQGNLARLGMLSGLLNGIRTLGPVATVTTALMPMVSYSITVFLERVYQEKALQGQVQDVQLVLRVNEVGQAAAAVLCAISTQLARTNGTVATNCLVTLIPLLQPGEQPTGGVDSGWVNAGCQQAVGVLAVGMAKEMGADFKKALASLTAEAQAQIQGALRAGVTGSRLESKFSLEHAAVGQDRREGSVPIRPSALAAATGGSKPASMFNLSKFKASAASTNALKPAAAPSQAVDVSAFLQGDDDFSRALRAKARGAVEEDDAGEEDGDGQVPGMEQPTGQDNDEDE